MIRPLFDHIVVVPTEAKTEVGGIIIPNSAQKKEREGTVVAAGPGKFSEYGVAIPMKVHVGDVIIHAYQGAVSRVDGQEVLIFPSHMVLAVIEA